MAVGHGNLGNLRGCISIQIWLFENRQPQNSMVFHRSWLRYFMAPVSDKPQNISVSCLVSSMISQWNPINYLEFIGGFLKWGYLQIIHFNRSFHCKPSSYWSTTILGNHHMISWSLDMFPSSRKGFVSSRAMPLQLQRLERPGDYIKFTMYCNVVQLHR